MTESIDWLIPIAVSDNVTLPNQIRTIESWQNKIIVLIKKVNK